MRRTVDLDAVSYAVRFFGNTDEHSCHVTILARPTPPPPPYITHQGGVIITLHMYMYG